MYVHVNEFGDGVVGSEKLIRVSGREFEFGMNEDDDGGTDDDHGEKQHPHEPQRKDHPLQLRQDA